MEDIEKLYHQKNKLGHPTIEEISEDHQKLLQDMLSFPMKNNLKITESSNSALKTPNDMYKDLLLQRIKTYKEQTLSEE